MKPATTNTTKFDRGKPTRKTGAAKTQPSGYRFLLEFSPLLIFFIANWGYGITIATIALVAATAIALPIVWRLEGRVPVLALAGCCMVAFFGGLTIILADEIYIKIKPTIASLAIAGFIGMGFMLGRNPVKWLMQHSMPADLAPATYRQLTWCFIAMFVTIAIANEIAWRTLTTSGWVSFKVFGLTAISLVFTIVLAFILARGQYTAKQ